MEHYYEVSVNWLETRLGSLSSDQLSTQIEVVTPPEFKGGIAGKWSPEHLFVAAVNSCLMTTFLALAENSKLVFTSFKSSAVGKLEAIDGRYLISEVKLRPEVIITSSNDFDKAMRILNKAETACLISNSITSTIVFQPKVVLAGKAMV